MRRDFDRSALFSFRRFRSTCSVKLGKARQSLIVQSDEKHLSALDRTMKIPAMKFWKKRTDDRSSIVSAPQNLSLFNGGLWRAEEGRRRGREWEAERIQDTARWNADQQRGQQAQRWSTQQQRPLVDVRTAEERRLADDLERDRLQREHIAEERRREEEKQRAARELRQQSASTQTIRQLRDLIREKHRLDHYVWNKRGVLSADRPIIMEDCGRADVALKQIYDIVGAWGPDQFRDQEEWLVAKRIKDSINRQRERDQHPDWCSIPPWERDDNGESRIYDLSPY